MAGLSHNRSSPQLTTTGQLLGKRSSQGIQSKSLVRNYSGATLRRRHSTDTVESTPLAYTGKFIGTALLKKNRTVENTSDTAMPSSQGFAELDSPMQRRASGSTDNDALACRLALKHRLMYPEVKRIVNEFAGVKITDAGGMKRADFEKIMAKIFDVPKVDPRIAGVAYNLINADTEVNVEKFLGWYVQNMFTQVNALNGDATKIAQDQCSTGLAREHGVSAVLIDKIRMKFNKFDLDGGGTIDYDEFEEMMRIVLKAETVDELNPRRIQRFWSECDKDSSEAIEFPEFVAWYLKYFGETEDMDSSGIIEAYYRSFDPSKQRRKSLSTVPLERSDVAGA